MDIHNLNKLREFEAYLKGGIDIQIKMPKRPIGNPCSYTARYDPELDTVVYTVHGKK